MPPRKLTMAQNAAWNTAGSLVYNLCLWAVTLAVVRLSADYTAPGRLQLAMAVSNIFAVASSWELKTCLVSDVGERYSAGEYMGAQLLAGAAALLACVGYAAAFGYGGETLATVGLFMLFRCLGSRAEVCYGVEQKHFRMDYVGLSFLLRGAGMLLAFSVGLRLTGSVAVGAALMAGVTAAVLWLYDRPHAARFEPVRAALPWRRLGRLLVESLPAVLSAALLTAVVTLPRQTLESLQGTEALGIYATVAAPVVVLQVLSVSIFDPAVRSAAELWAAGRTRELGRLGARLLGMLAGIGALALIGARLLGRWALVLLYGESIGPHSGLLGPVVCCAVLYSACWLLSRMLIVLREMKRQLLFTALSLAGTVLPARALIAAYGGNGVSFAVLTGYAMFFALSLWHIVRRLRRGERGEEDHGA